MIKKINKFIINNIIAYTNKYDIYHVLFYSLIAKNIYFNLFYYNNLDYIQNVLLFSLNYTY